MRRLFVALVALAVGAAACSDSGGVDPDAIDGLELAAVRRALNSAFAGDTNFLILEAFVFQFIDRASRAASPDGDTVRLTGVQLDIDAVQGDTPVVARMSGVLAWRGYNSAARVVDTVVFVIGAGITPPAVDDSLRESFSPDTAGTGTGVIVHQATGGATSVWEARAGHLRATGATYGAGQRQTAGGVTLTTFRGTLTGDYAITAKLRTDTTNAQTSGAVFPQGIRAVKVQITGSLP